MPVDNVVVGHIADHADRSGASTGFAAHGRSHQIIQADPHTDSPSTEDERVMTRNI